MVKTKIKALSLITALFVLFGSVSFAQIPHGGASGVGITLGAQSRNTFLVPVCGDFVQTGLAERYGYTNDASIVGTSVLDALVRAHEIAFGERFTPETAGEFLLVTNGSMQRVFGEDTYNFGYTVNGAQPHGDVWTEGGGGFPGYYNAYSVSQAQITDGDSVEFFVFSDTYGLDLYSWFEYGGAKVSELSAAAGENISLTLRGYSIGWYGASNASTIEAQTQEISSAQLTLLDEYGSMTDLDGKITDDSGEINVSFDTAGTYTLSAYVSEEEISENYATPIVSPILTIKVREGSDESVEADLQTLYNAFNGIYTKENPLAFAYGTGEGEYTNALTLVRTLAAQLLPERDISEISVEADMGSECGMVGEGTALAAKTMDLQGNITPVYSEQATMPALVNLRFVIDSQHSDTIDILHMTVPPLEADADKRLELEAGALTWKLIKGENTNADYVTKSLATLPSAGAIYTQGVSITWMLEKISGADGALILDEQNNTAVSRPQEGEAESVYRLEATVCDASAGDRFRKVSFNLFVPAERDESDDYPSAVSAYLPAPGQFVNLPQYGTASCALSPSSDRVITLGAFGGSVVYYFDKAIENDEHNPYGIDFIVHGNVFKNADGTSAESAAESAAVMVSLDGESWYELAGSMYYDANTRRYASVTYTNPDESFSGAEDVIWENDCGNRGVIRKIAYQSQPYYPNPSYYNPFNTGALKNDSYTASSVSFNGTAIGSTGVAAYGYGDTHASRLPLDGAAVNPYRENHLSDTNGDGFDLSWAVDSDGKMVSIEKVHYVKIYSAAISNAVGEISPEIAGVVRARAAAQSVGRTDDLSELLINGRALPLETGVYEYSFDGEGASSFAVTAVGGTDDNIYVNDTFVRSGEATTPILTNGSLRIVVQNGQKQPVIYTLTPDMALGSESNAELAEVSVIPGQLAATLGENNTYSVTVHNGVSAVCIRALPLNTLATVSVDGETLSAQSDWTSQSSISLVQGQKTSIGIEVISPDMTQSEHYTLEITRQSGSGSGGVSDNTIKVEFSLIGDTKHAVGAHSGFETWLAKKTYTVPKNSTVKYITDMVLIGASIPFKTDSQGSYIIDINGLSEFDNGANSGWMYKLNGIHESTSGYAQQRLNDGDAVVWHYSDDFTKEDGGYSGGYNSGTSFSGGKKDENTDKDDTGVSTPPTEDKKGENKAMFADVAEHWARSAIEIVAKKGLFIGTGGTNFSPDEAMSRAMLVTALHRLDGEKKPTSRADFYDVASGAWYADAVSWAAENKIVNGSGSAFLPSVQISREELAAIIYRYADAVGADMTADGDELGGFADKSDVSDWAQGALSWCVKNGIIKGRGDNILEPKSGATRAEVCTVICRLLDLVSK